MTLARAVRKAIEESLSARFGMRLQVADEVHNFRMSCVFRCRLLGSSHSAPETVVVRVPRNGTVRAGRTGLQHERAGLEYLTAIGSSLAPRFLAGSGAEGFLITEDLGDEPSLLDLLLGKDPEAARQGLFGFARGLGSMHAQTAEHQTGPRAGLPAASVPVAEHWQQVRNAVTQLELPAPQGVDGSVEAVARLLSESGACLALSSGDPSVVNCKIIGGNVKFFDFEEACFRSAFVDAALLRYLYPTGGPPWRLPHEVTLQIEATYRDELAQACSVARYNDKYEQGMAAACAAWAILRLARLPRVDAGPDRDSWLLLPPDWSTTIPTRSRRRQLVSILEIYIAAGRRAGTFAPLTFWCERLMDALRERWPEAAEELPLYPAFQ